MLTERRSLLTLLVISATALLVVGVAIERSDEHAHDEPATARPDASEAAEHSEAAGHDEAARHAERTTAAGKQGEHAEAGEHVLGVDVESWPVIAAVAAASLALAAAVWSRPSGPLPLIAALALAVFAVADLREVLHQLDEDRAGLAILAGLIAALHATAAALAARPSRPRSPGATIPG